MRARLEDRHEFLGTPIAKDAYLDFSLHALEDIVELFRDPDINCRHSDVPNATKLRLICVDLTNIGHGDRLGPQWADGVGEYCLARENRNHFVPCHMDESGERHIGLASAQPWSMADLCPRGGSASSSSGLPALSKVVDIDPPCTAAGASVATSSSTGKDVEKRSI